MMQQRRQKSMQPGALRLRLMLEKAEEQDDQAGGFSRAWQSVATLWASVQPRQAYEIATSSHLTDEISHMVTVRWRGDIKAGMRLRKGKRIFSILSVRDPHETRFWLICACREEPARE